LSDTKRKDDLLRKLSELQDVSADVEEGFRAGIEQAVQNRDVESRMTRLVGSLTRDDQLPPEAWDQFEYGVQARLDASRMVRAQMQEMVVFQGTSTANVSSSSTVVTRILSFPVTWPQGINPTLSSTAPSVNVLEQSPLASWTTAQRAALSDFRDGLQNAFRYRDLLPDIAALIAKLRAGDTHPGDRTALEQFHAARRALEQPPGGLTSPPGVLVELRGGLNNLLERLRRRLAGQDSGGGVERRVISIGKRAGFQIFAGGHFESIGRDLERLAADLTDAKNAEMTREEVSNTLNEVLFVVKTLLTSIDPSRLRP